MGTQEDWCPMYTSSSPRLRESFPTPHLLLLLPSFVSPSRQPPSHFLLRKPEESLLMVLLEDLFLTYRSMLLTSALPFALDLPMRLIVSTTGLLRRTKLSGSFALNSMKDIYIVCYI